MTILNQYQLRGPVPQTGKISHFQYSVQIQGGNLIILYAMMADVISECCKGDSRREDYALSLVHPEYANDLFAQILSQVPDPVEYFTWYTLALTMEQRGLLNSIAHDMEILLVRRKAGALIHNFYDLLTDIRKQLRTVALAIQ